MIYVTYKAYRRNKSINPPPTTTTPQKKKKKKKKVLLGLVHLTIIDLNVRLQCSALPTAIFQHTKLKRTFSNKIVYYIKLFVTFSK